jgi:hypothetical protein
MIRHAPHGATRFRVFPAYAEGYTEPETILIASPPGTIGPGPCDDRLATRNAIGKPGQYAPPDFVPPWRGPVYPPACPDPSGHFDHIPVESHEFMSAHLYAVVRHTLDVWEGLLGTRILWWHHDINPRIELVPLIDWANAHSGPGFIETGMKANKTGREQYFCLNFDVAAHETGHAILYSQVGVPALEHLTAPFLAFHESFSDLIALIAKMGFRSVIERLLAQTEGNLYVLCILNRIAELSSTEQVRIAANGDRMRDLEGVRLGPDLNWIDPSGEDREAHGLAAPLTGAMFDIIVELFQDRLVSRGIIAPAADARGWTRAAVANAAAHIHDHTRRARRHFHDAFVAALDDARLLVGRALAHVIHTIRPETLTYARVAARFMEAMDANGAAAHLPAILAHFLWRDIDPRPHLAMEVAPSRRRHGAARRLRATDPARDRHGCDCTDHRSFLAAHILLPHGHRRG